MKNKLLILFILTSATTSVYSQKSRQAYCEVIVWSHQIMFHALVSFDFGMQSNNTVMLYDTKNQPLKFITGMDLVNYLSKRGWKLVSTYYESISESESIHFVMEKTIMDEKQVKAGLNMRQIKLEDFFRMFGLPNFSPN